MDKISKGLATMEDYKQISTNMRRFIAIYKLCISWKEENKVFLDSLYHRMEDIIFEKATTDKVLHKKILKSLEESNFPSKESYLNYKFKDAEVEIPSRPPSSQNIEVQPDKPNLPPSQSLETEVVETQRDIRPVSHRTQNIEEERTPHELPPESSAVSEGEDPEYYAPSRYYIHQDVQLESKIANLPSFLFLRIGIL